MYAYGAFGWSAYLGYNPGLVRWLEEGGIFVLPGVRGGGEAGEEWHQAGIRENRSKAVDDYVDTAEWLVEQGWTRPERILATGGSISAGLASAVVLRRPDLFGAAVVASPAMDMIRYHLHTLGGSWIRGPAPGNRVVSGSARTTLTPRGGSSEVGHDSR